MEHAHPDDHPLIPAILTSLIRTVVPIIVTALGTILAKVGFDISADEGLGQLLALSIGGIISTVYYAVVRIAEERISPLWGWLLGRAKKPSYGEPR